MIASAERECQGKTIESRGYEPGDSPATRLLAEGEVGREYGHEEREERWRTRLLTREAQTGEDVHGQKECKRDRREDEYDQWTHGGAPASFDSSSPSVGATEPASAEPSDFSPARSLFSAFAGSARPVSTMFPSGSMTLPLTSLANASGKGAGTSSPRSLQNFPRAI